MIGVSKQVGRELVIIPYKSILDVVLDTVERDFCKIFIHHKLVKALYAHIDGKSFQRSFPWMFLLAGWVIGCINLHQTIGCWEILVCLFIA